MTLDMTCPNCSRGMYGDPIKRSLKPVGSLRAPTTWVCVHCGWEIKAGSGSGPDDHSPRPGKP